MAPLGTTYWANGQTFLPTVPDNAEAVIGVIDAGLANPWEDGFHVRALVVASIDANTTAWRLKLRRESLTGDLIGPVSLWLPAAAGDVVTATLAVEGVVNVPAGGPFRFVVTSTQVTAGAPYEIQGVTFSAVSAPNLIPYL